MTALTAAREMRYPWAVVGMLWCISFLNYADRQAVFSVFPLLEKEMGLTPVQLGLLGSSFAWVYGLAAPFSGALVDRIRRTHAILGGLHVWSVICMATATARTFPQLLFFRAAEGLGESAYFPGAMSLISDFHGKRTRSRAMGFHQTSVYMGTIAGGFFAGLIGKLFGWRWSFIVFGAAGILHGLTLWRFLCEPERGAAEDSPEHSYSQKTSFNESVRIIFGAPAARLLMAAFLCANFVAAVLLSWMPKFLYDKFQMDLATAGLTATLYVQVAAMVGSPIGGWLADALRRRTAKGRMLVQAAGVLGSAPFVVLCALTESVPTLIFALTGWGLFKGCYDANIFASLYDVIGPKARGSAAGFMNTVGWLGGGGTAPLAIGFVAQKYPLSIAIALAATVYLAAAVLLLVASLYVKGAREGSAPV